MADEFWPYLRDEDPDGDAELLVLGWGSVYGPVKVAVERARDRGKKVARAHVYHLNPLPRNTGEVLRKYPRILVPEMNTGQLSRIVRAEYLVDALVFSKVQGQPFFADELEDEIIRRLT
jgi:2-oxoglutarate ferredoxin oxidoreductase subunit alpha